MMHRKAILGCGLVCLLALPALAAEGRVPIFQPTVIAGPGADGKYILTRNIAAPLGSGAAIQVLGAGTEEVDIDLNGFTVFGDPAGGVDVIEASGLRTLRIHNGSVRPLGPPPGTGVSVQSTGRVILEDLRIADGETGISLTEVSNYMVRDNVVNGAGVGILIQGAGIIHTGLVAGNQVKNSGLIGITVEDESSSLILRDNRVDKASDVGIHVLLGSSCLVAENTVQNAGIGILLEQLKGCKVVNNVASANGSGISSFATEDGLFLDNVASDNQENGIYADGARNKFEGNQASTNGCFGMWLAGRDNTFGRNQARGNTAGSAACPGVAACTVLPVEVCPAPLGGGSTPPDLCVSAVGNTSYCDNLMPGPPPS